jgi:hypothetical protein
MMMSASTICSSVLILVLFASCDPGITEESPDGPVEATAHEVRAAAPERRDVGQQRAGHAVRSDASVAAELAGALRPIDSPLPSRAQLEAACADPVEPLLELSLLSWPDGIVRGNALVELGLFPESGEAMDRLLEVAMDGARPAPDRTAALEGLIVTGDAVEPHVAELMPLLGHDRVMVQAAAVRLLGPWPAARSEVQHLAEGEDTDFDVRRFARRALEADGSR